MLKEKQTLLHFVTLLIISLNFTISSQSFLITKYSTDTGLPDNRINDIAQDSLGRIWVAMASGIAMYDGYEWIKYGEKNGVPEIDYKKIKVDEKNVIWFMPAEKLNHHIIYFKQNQWEKIGFDGITKFKANAFGSIQVVYENNFPAVYLTTIVGGLFKFYNGVWKHFTRKDGLTSDTLTNTIYDGGKLIVSASNGISSLSPDNKIENIVVNSNTSSHIVNCSYNDGKIFLLGLDWFGYVDNYQIKVLFDNFHIPYSGVNEQITSIHYTRNILFFSSTAVIYSVDLKTKTLKKIILDLPTSDRGATSIYVDYEKNIWVTSLRGIYKLTLTPFENYSKQSGLLENEVSLISEFNNGDKIFGHNYGLTIKSGKSFKQIQFNDPIKNDALISRVLSGYHDFKSDIIYFTSLENGVGKLYNDGKLKWIKADGVRRYPLIYFNRDNEISVHTTQGIYSLVNDRLLKNKSLNVLMVRNAATIEDSLTVLVSPSGLWFSNNSKFYRVKTQNDITNNFYSIFYNKELGILAGSIKGVFKFENKILVPYNFPGYNIVEPIYFIIRDFSKNIWLGTNNGVLKWDGKYLKRYNKSDGLSGNETNRAAGFVDNKGNVWIGTDEGVSMYSGNEPDYSSFPPKAMILDLKDHTNLSYKINSNVSIDPDNNNLTFHYRGLSFINEKQNLFQIKLTDVDGDYKNEFITRSTSTRFNSVAAGDYIFSVRVQNSKGIWSEWKSSSVITVKEHFYNEPYFYVSVLGLFLFIAYTTNNYLQQKKYTKRLEHDVDVRTKDLRDTQEQLITSANRYKGIIESQSDLVIRITETGILTFVNDAYCAVFGKKREELIGKSFVPLVHPEDVEFTFEEMKKLNIPPYRSTLEQRALTIDGYRWFSWEGYAIHDHEGNVLEIQAVGRDITIQKEVETELEKRVNERTIELQSLIAQSPLGILTFDSDGYLITYNKIASEMFYSLKEYAPPKKDFNLFKDYYLVKNNYSEKLLALDQPNSFLLTSPIFIDDPQNKVYKKLLNHYLVYRIYNVHFDEVHKMFVLLVDDVTEQQVSEEVSKKLLEEKIRISTIIKTIESERERFAKELHDGLGQLLTTAKLKLDIIKIKSDKSITEINDTVNILINAGDEIRRIISDLKPADVERFGLDSSIELLVERIRQNTSKKILLSILTGIQIQNKNIEIVVYRIVQEALNNMVKYSQCNNAMVELSSTNNELQLKISDDGIGFDMTKQDEKFKSYGINNIKERVSSLNGKIEIKSKPGKGFSYHIIIPL